MKLRTTFRKACLLGCAAVLVTAMGARADENHDHADDHKMDPLKSAFEELQELHAEVDDKRVSKALMQLQAHQQAHAVHGHEHVHEDDHQVKALKLALDELKAYQEDAQDARLEGSILLLEAHKKAHIAHEHGDKDADYAHEHREDHRMNALNDAFRELQAYHAENNSEKMACVLMHLQTHRQAHAAHEHPHHHREDHRMEAVDAAMRELQALRAEDDSEDLREIVALWQTHQLAHAAHEHRDSPEASRRADDHEHEDDHEISAFNDAVTKLQAYKRNNDDDEGRAAAALLQLQTHRQAHYAHDHEHAHQDEHRLEAIEAAVSALRAYKEDNDEEDKVDSILAKLEEHLEAHEAHGHDRHDTVAEALD